MLPGAAGEPDGTRATRVGFTASMHGWQLMNHAAAVNEEALCRQRGTSGGRRLSCGELGVL